MTSTTGGLRTLQRKQSRPQLFVSQGAWLQPQPSLLCLKVPSESLIVHSTRRSKSMQRKGSPLLVRASYINFNGRSACAWSSSQPLLLAVWKGDAACVTPRASKQVPCLHSAARARD
jgi:hypothetical protein